MKPRVVWQITLTVALMIGAGPSRADVLVEFSGGEVSGTFTSENTFPLKGWHVGGGAALSYAYGPSLTLLAGGYTRLAKLDYRADGIRKAVTWYQIGCQGSGLVRMGTNAQLQLKVGLLPYSEFFVSSNTEFTVNETPYRIKTHSLYDGGLGKEIELGLFWRLDQGKTRLKTVRYGVAVGSLTQTFLRKKEHTANTTGTAGSEDVIQRSSGDFSVSALVGSLVIGATF